MVSSANSVYHEFLRSEEGQGFRGEVSGQELWLCVCVCVCGWVGVGVVSERVRASGVRVGCSE